MKEIALCAKMVLDFIRTMCELFSRQSTPSTMKTYYIEFDGKGKHADGEEFGHTESKSEAIKGADREARSSAGHVDFKHGSFKVYESDSATGCGELIHEAFCATR